MGVFMPLKLPPRRAQARVNVVVMVSERERNAKNTYTIAPRERARLLVPLARARLLAPLGLSQILPARHLPLLPLTPLTMMILVIMIVMVVMMMKSRLMIGIIHLTARLRHTVRVRIEEK